jgi:VanZ family protein
MSTPRAAGARRAAIWWIAVVAWMAVIFVLSSQPDSDLTGGHRLTIGVYNLAHLIVFAVLGVLVVGATRHLNMPRATWWAWVIVVLYAITDEIHQAFVPGRTSLVTDVGIDSIGGLLGLFGYAIPEKIREGRAWPLTVLVGIRPPPGDANAIDAEGSLDNAG